VDRNGILIQAKRLAKNNLGIPLLLLAILGMVTLPVPPILLDVAFTFNIAISIIVLLIAMYALKPLDFAVFPTVLLGATLLRLALNVASTRVVLLEGHKGGDAAGKVIESFGDVVVGGNYVVGIIVFAILVIINFVVVTKGAGRISEVSARFTLDALPGKQMAIDADLNSGLINQEEAKTRRVEVAAEADFYGSMDGASKFVKGDAVAGILILVINLLGGLGIGMAQHDLDFSTAVEYYSLLTIGDGLVAQIPSLFLSVSAAIMVTRANTSEGMGEQISKQMFSSSRALYVTAVIVGTMGLVPGMPMAFVALGLCCGTLGWYMGKMKKELADNKKESDAELGSNGEDVKEKTEVDWTDVMPVDMIGLEVGYGLIPMVEEGENSQLLSRIRAIRKKLSQDLGFLVPSVHIRDNLDLLPNQYVISIMGVTLGKSEVFLDRSLAINGGVVYGPIDGTATVDPTFGLEAVWIDENQNERAQTMGYTVVDSSTVIATHLNDILTSSASDLIGHEEVQSLIDMTSERTPRLIEEIIPKRITTSTVMKVLQNLLKEYIPVRDFKTIIETLADASTKTQDPNQLTIEVRLGLSRLIVQTIAGDREDLPVVTLDPSLEQMLIQSVDIENSEQRFALDPGMAEELQKSLEKTALDLEAADMPSILMVSAPIRALMAKFVRYNNRRIHVVSYQEVPDNKKVSIVSTVGGQTL
jgi:flagellar biosynthesis protein FlhA